MPGKTKIMHHGLVGNSLIVTPLIEFNPYRLRNHSCIDHRVVCALHDTKTTDLVFDKGHIGSVNVRSKKITEPIRNRHLGPASESWGCNRTCVISKNCFADLYEDFC